MRLLFPPGPQAVAPPGRCGACVLRSATPANHRERERDRAQEIMARFRVALRARGNLSHVHPDGETHGEAFSNGIR